MQSSWVWRTHRRIIVEVIGAKFQKWSPKHIHKQAAEREKCECEEVTVDLIRRRK